MAYKNIIRVVVIICLVVAAYFAGEQRGLERGIEISAVFTQSGRSADQANMIALLLGFSRRGEEEKMYEWGERFIVQNIDNYNNIQSTLEKESTPIKDTAIYELLDVMVNSSPSTTTEAYIETYIEGGKSFDATLGN
ncbi:hypothetical protein [Microbulbifer hydrolyticus]|uniref:Uncharacterized protein n=1 Tax=Microbulbifer hydrolyticus TaxID=48074 RepID=A0A6P1TBM6_9GAMM|nr:hypothetical protein [Microbulbifer hydrolyticus]MBB5213123.1 hypothetical protein [Microbulbifer hydrolyticus]QHQ38669.1 hypothetical protein GTQ55_06480 [Microbulbifer hydrolyticus]